MSNEKNFEVMAGIFKALSDPTRLRIVHQLAEGEKCVQDLHEGTGKDMSTISRHLTILKIHKVIESRREKTFIYYKLKSKFILDLFPCLGSMLGDIRKEEF